MLTLNLEILKAIARQTGDPVWKIKIDLGSPPTKTCPAVNQDEAMRYHYRAVVGSEEEYVALQKWDKLSIQALETARTVLDVCKVFEFSSQSAELQVAACKKTDSILMESIKSANTAPKLLKIIPFCHPNSPARQVLIGKLYNLTLPEPAHL